MLIECLNLAKSVIFEERSSSEMWDKRCLQKDFLKTAFMIFEALKNQSIDHGIFFSKCNKFRYKYRFSFKFLKY